MQSQANRMMYPVNVFLASISAVCF